MQALLELNTLIPKSPSRQAGSASIGQQNYTWAFPNTQSQVDVMCLVKVVKTEKAGSCTEHDYTKVADSYTWKIN
jgi:hypothetical protein